jgi:hypothetical protein
MTVTSKAKRQPGAGVQMQVQGRRTSRAAPSDNPFSPLLLMWGRLWGFEKTAL